MDINTEFSEVITRVEKLFEDYSLRNINEDELAGKLKNFLNETFADEKNNFHPVECKNVFISKQSCDPFYIVVIPEMPIVGDSILSINHITKYSIDIDVTNMITSEANWGLNAHEMTTWFMHEFFANVVSDTTFIRYKKLLIKYYDLKNKEILNAHNNLGYLSWFRVFGNTEKEKISEMSNDYVSNCMKMVNLADEWNIVLDKYVSVCGGDYTIISKTQVERDDKEALEIFNKLARKYNTYAIKYANRDWRILSNYLGSMIGSELLKFYIKREPEHIAVIPEKESFDFFDSRRLLYENIDMTNNFGLTSQATPITYMEMDKGSLATEIQELELDVDNVETMSDKLYVASKLKDFMRSVQDKLDKTELVDESLLGLRERAYQAARKLDAIDATEVSELEIR